MIIPPHIPLYGDPTYRGKCDREQLEQMSIIGRIRREYPDSYGLIVLHPRNEGLKERGQFSSVMRHNAEGMCKGAADVIIPASRSFVCEVKRRNPMLSKLAPEQIDFLTASQKAGAFVCVALGAVAAWQAFEDWVREQQ